MGYGKTIELFFVDGTSDGIVTAEILNWSGKAIKIPRTEIKNSKREDITGAGVYFLLCDESDGSYSIYVGEAENVKDRLVIHMNDYNGDKEKYYWANALIFVGNDLNKTLIRYLENRLADIINKNKKIKVLTKNTYKNTVIKESQIASMEEFIDNIKVLVKAFGYDFLDEIKKPKSKEEYLYCKGNGASAKGFLSPNGFTVLKDSIISDHISDSFKLTNLSKMRTDLEDKGIIINRKFNQDYEFSSPSRASSIILGRSSNGNLDWINENKISLKELDK